MYRGLSRIILGKEEISKIEKMLIEKWHVENLVITDCLAYWEISFLTDDPKKVFQLPIIVKYYGGDVLDNWIYLADNRNDLRT